MKLAGPVVFLLIEIAWLMVRLPRRNGSLRLFFVPGLFHESSSLPWQVSTARVTSHIPSLYSNAHPPYPPIIEDDLSYVPSKGWAEMIRNIYEVDPQLCPSRGRGISILFH